jgi:hypothetical protein
MTDSFCEFPYGSPSRPHNRPNAEKVRKARPVRLSVEVVLKRIARVAALLAMPVSTLTFGDRQIDVAHRRAPQVGAAGGQ